MISYEGAGGYQDFVKQMDEVRKNDNYNANLIDPLYKILKDSYGPGESYIKMD